MKTKVSKVNATKENRYYKPKLKKLVKAVLASITVATALCVTNPVMAQSFASSNVAESVRLPNAEYTQSVLDMRVKVLGGEVRLERTWVNGRWYLNSAWANLRFMSDPLDESIKTIDRAGTEFKRSGDANLYAAGKSYIRKTEEGWRWYNPNGEWITYDQAGRMTAYGDRNDIRVDFVLDTEGRRTGVKDHHGNLVYTFTYDAEERLTSVTDAEERKVEYRWNGSLLEKVIDVSGYEWQYKYDNNGQLVERIEPDDGTIKVTYTYSTPAAKPAMTSGKNAGEVVSGSLTSTLANNADTKIARVGSMTEKTGAITLWQVDYNKQSRHYTTTVEDALGKKTASVYDAQGRLVSYSINGEVQTTIERDGEFQTKNTNARGFSQTTQYDHAKNPVKVIMADGSVVTYTYDNTFNRPLTYVNQLGISTEWTYDNKGNALTRIDAVGKEEQRFNSWTYDAVGQAVTYSISTQADASEADKITTHYTYDANGNIKSVTDPMGNPTQLTHNNQGQMTSVTNALGHTWTYDYTSAGHLKTITNPSGDSISFTSDAQGRITQMIDAEGRSSTVNYGYKDKGLTVTKTDALNNATVYQFDSLNQLLSVTLPSGEQVKQTYDARGRLEQQIDFAGNITKTQYGDAGTQQAGMPINMLYPTYQESSQYNTLGLPTEVKQQIGEGQDSGQLTTHMSYNALGMLLSMTTPNGATTQLQYDAHGNQVKHIDAMGSMTQQTYDVWGNVTSVVDAKGNTHRFEYDKNSNLVKEFTPSGQVTSYAYDAADQLIRKQDAAGNITKFEYNAVGLMVKETLMAAEQQEGVDAPEQTVDYVYDKNGTLLEATKVSSRGGDINTHHKFTRDELGRIVREDVTYGSGSNAITKTLRYGYDADGRKTSITYPDGSVQTTSYEHGQLKTMTRPDGKTVSWSAYEWLRAQQLEAPSVKQVLSYDALQRTAGIEAKTPSNQPLLERTYLYDKAGNIITRNTEEGEYTYGYDQLSRLKQVNPPQSAQQKGLPQESYAYDAVHNRVGSSHQAGQWLYNQDNQLVKFGAGVEETSYTYTQNGHVQTETKGGITRTYTYDAADRLVRVTNTVAGTETEIARYAYDPFGRRVSKTVNGETTYFIYTQEGLVAELNEGGDVTRAYGWELNTMYGTTPLWQAEVTNNKLNTAQFHTLITDHLGTPQMAVNDQGTLTWKAVSESFGKTFPNTQNQITMNLRFPGQYYDEETNSHYNYFRDYNPQTGRYLQKDPIGLDAGINWYGYVGGNPLKYIDFNGLQPVRRNNNTRRDLGVSSWTTSEIIINNQTINTIIQIQRINPSYTYATITMPGRPQFNRRDLQRTQRDLNEIGWEIRNAENTGGMCVRDYRAVQSYMRRIEEHARKRDDFAQNPTVRPGMEHLPPEVIQRQQQQRIDHLNQEMNTFYNNLYRIIEK